MVFVVVDLFRRLFHRRKTVRNAAIRSAAGGAVIPAALKIAAVVAPEATICVSEATAVAITSMAYEGTTAASAAALAAAETAATGCASVSIGTIAAAVGQVAAGVACVIGAGIVIYAAAKFIGGIFTKLFC